MDQGSISASPVFPVRVKGYSLGHGEPVLHRLSSYQYRTKAFFNRKRTKGRSQGYPSIPFGCEGCGQSGIPLVRGNQSCLEDQPTGGDHREISSIVSRPWSIWGSPVCAVRVGRPM